MKSEGVVGWFWTIQNRRSPMPATDAGQTITLERDVRAFLRTGPRSSLLTKLHLRWIKRSETIELGPTHTMCFDHGDHDAAQIMGIDEERFVILRELSQTPWHLVKRTE